VEKMWKNRLKWFSHLVMRGVESEKVRFIMEMSVAKGEKRKRWVNGIQSDTRIAGMNQ